MRSHQGLTLIELVMTLAIMSIIAVTALALMPDPSTMRREAARHKLVQDLRYAQSLAVTGAGTFGIIFNPAGESYSVYQNNPSNIITNPENGKSFTIDYTSDPDLTGVEIDFTDLNGDFVEFDLYGTPSDQNGEFGVNDDRQIVFSGGSLRGRASTALLTSSVQIFEETGYTR